MFWTMIGIAAATLTTFAYIPQVWKMVNTKHAKDVSVLTLYQLAFGVSLWIAYGFSRKDPIIVIANIVTLLTLIVALTAYYKYR